MNKQEKNIIDIITLEDITDIVNVFIDQAYYTDKTVALIANKELVSSAMSRLLIQDETSVKKIDMELEDVEYMISVNDDGDIVVQPIEFYDDEYFIEIEYAYVDMDGYVEQMTIDNLINRDVTVVLFGIDEDDVSDNEEYEPSCQRCDAYQCLHRKNRNSENHVEYSKDEDGNMHGFTASRSDGNSYYSYSVYTTNNLSQKDIQALLQEVGF